MTPLRRATWLALLGPFALLVPGFLRKAEEAK